MSSFKSEEIDKENTSPGDTTLNAKERPYKIDFDYDPDGSLSLSSRKAKVYLVPMVVNCELLFGMENGDTRNASPDPVLPPRKALERCLQGHPYQEDILGNLRLTEWRRRPLVWYMRKQKHFNHRDRYLLVDWLVEMSIVHELETETLHLAVSHVDRYLSREIVTSDEVKVLGVTALFIAVKYEEKSRELEFITDSKEYTMKEVRRLEINMLKVLDLYVSTPTACVFINSYAALCELPDKLKYLTLYIAELTLMNGTDFMRFVPSVMSSASLALARYTLGLEMWTQQLEEITTYTLPDLRGLIRKLSSIHKLARGMERQTVRVKYMGKKYLNVAMIEAIDLTMDHLDKLCLEYANLPPIEKEDIDL